MAHSPASRTAHLHEGQVALSTCRAVSAHRTKHDCKCSASMAAQHTGKQQPGCTVGQREACLLTRPSSAWQSQPLRDFQGASTMASCEVAAARKIQYIINVLQRAIPASDDRQWPHYPAHKAQQPSSETPSTEQPFGSLLQRPTAQLGSAPD